MNKVGHLLYKFALLFLLGCMFFELVYKGVAKTGVEMRDVNHFFGGFLFASAFYFAFYKMPKIIEWMVEKRQREVDE